MKNPLVTGLSVLCGALLWAPVYAAPLSGAYTIDKTGSGDSNYISFTAASDALYKNGINGNVTFKVADGTYNEKVIIRDIAGTKTYYITFESASGDSTRVILTSESSNSYSVPDYTVLFQSTQHHVWRHMTIQRTGNGIYGTVIRLASSFAVAINYNRLLGPVYTSASTVTDGAIIYGEEESVSSTTIYNNVIRGGWNGIRIWNTSSKDFYLGIKILGNTIDSSYYGAIRLTLMKDAIIEKNRITGKNSNYGIYLADCLGNDISVRSNFIYLKSTVTTCGVKLENISSFSGDTGAIIANNFITIDAPAPSAGIALATTITTTFYGGYINVCYNSINMVYNADKTRGIEIHSQYKHVYDLYNNNIGCLKGYPIYVDGSTTIDPFNSSNYNNFYSEGDYTGYYYGTKYPSLSLWSGATGYDETSVSRDPDFVSATNLHVNSPWLSNAGHPVKGVTDDFDGQKRNGLAPDIGADEFDLRLADPGISVIDSPVLFSCGNGNRPIHVTLKNYGTDTLKSVEIQWNLEGLEQAKIKWSGILLPAKDTSLAIDTFLFAPGTYNLSASTSMPNGKPDFFTANDAASILATVYKLPNAGFTWKATGSTISFSPNDSNFFQSKWSFGDSSIVEGDKTSHTYPVKGKYVVTHSVISQNGCEGKFSDTITIGNSGFKTTESAGSIHVYPNPFRSILTIDASENEAEILQVQMLDVSGRIIEVFTLPGNSKSSLNFSSIKPGLYVLKFTSKDTTSYTQIFKLD